ncbi:MAG: hypothetical protein WD294_14280 [Phycisphaeraceae bacterium]
MIQQLRSFPGRIYLMWQKSNIGTRQASRGSYTALALAFAVLLSLLGGPARAAEEAQPAQPLDEALARQAFTVAELWLQRAEIPSDTLAIEAEGLVAVHVTLRLEGRRLGQGSAAVDDPAAEAGAVDIMPLLRTALRTAVREAATREDDLAEKATQLALDVQFAHDLEPLNLSALAQLPDRFVPGLQGLAMRRNANWAWSFPGSVIATNTNLSGQVNRMLSQVDLPLDHLARIGTADGPPLYRFDAIHLVRPQPDADLLTLYRGNELLPPLPLDDRQLTQLTDTLLQNVLSRQRTNGRFAGTYEPTADTYSPVNARPVDAAAAAYALARTARLERLDPARREAAAQAAVRALERLTSPADAEQQRITNDLATSALTLLALLETPGAADLNDQRDRLAEAIISRHRADGSFASSAEDGDTSLATHALASAALVRIYDRTRDADVLERAHLSIDALWQRLADDPRRATDAMPWLAMVELDLDRLNQPTGYRSRLVETATAIWREQVQPLDEDAQRTSDIVGGFIVRDAFFPEPIWQSSRILAGQSMLLHDPTLIPADQRTAWLVNSARGARFLAQLTMQPTSAFYVQHPERAIGGTRTAMSNNRQPLAATAMSLLATVELENALARLTAASR